MVGECILRREVGIRWCATSNRCPSNNVQRTSLAARATSLFTPSSSFSFFRCPPCSPRTRFSIIDSLTRQDILLSDPRARYTPHRERDPGVCYSSTSCFTLDKSRSRPLINNFSRATRVALYYAIIEIISSRCANYQVAQNKIALFSLFIVHIAQDIASFSSKLIGIFQVRYFCRQIFICKTWSQSSSLRACVKRPSAD